MRERLRPRPTDNQDEEPSGGQLALVTVALAAFLLVALVIGPLTVRDAPPPDPVLQALVSEIVGEDFTFTVGAAPPDLRPYIVMPPRATLLGTRNSAFESHVYIQTELSAFEALAFYDEQFTAQGLTRIDTHAYPILFPPDFPLEVQAAYCDDHVGFSVQAREDGIVRFGFSNPERFEDAHCQPPKEAPTSPMGELALTQPSEMEERTTYSTFQREEGTTLFYTVRYTIPDADPAAILAHYDAQITARGWQRVTRGETYAIWSLTTEDEGTWEMTFTLARSPVTDEVHLGISGERVAP